MIKLTLRGWQSQFARKLAAHRRRDFLLVACPAAGKTLAAGAGVAAVMEARRCDQLVVVCPTVVVRDQWCRELGRLGFQMLTQFHGESWPAWVHGVCVTYAQVSQRAERYADACAARRTVVVFDEIHHAGEQLAWGTAIAEGFAAAKLRLMLSGTPFRSDEDRIPFVHYTEDGVCAPDFSYDYARAVREGVCRAIEFRAHDGVITWREGEGAQTARFSERVGEPACARRLRAALDPGKAYLTALLSAAHEDLLGLRERVSNAAGLVVCDTQAHALAVDELIARITGSMPVLAMSDLPLAHKAIVAFAEEDEPWLVSVRMVSEGVDIPRLGVIVWATAARTELMVRQVSGRALRGRGEYGNQPAIVHMPADPELVRYAQRLDVLGGAPPTGRSPRARRSEARVLGGEPAAGAERIDYRAIDAQPIDGAGPRVLAPALPSRRLHAAGEAIDIRSPELPLSPRAILAAEQERQARRGELFRSLAIYGQLRREIDPAYQLASAHRELSAAVGPLDATAPDERVAQALQWIRGQLAGLAASHPEELKELARARRRLALAA